MLPLFSAAVFGFWIGAAHGAATPVGPPREGFVPAPIHSDSVQTKITLKTSWPEHRPPPAIHKKTLHLSWDSKVRTPNGHSYPALLLTLELLLPVSVSLDAKADKEIKGEPFDNATDMFRLNVPVRFMDRNVTSFFVRFVDGSMAEFDLEYKITLDEMVFGADSKCERMGIRVNEVSEGKQSGFFFIKCVHEDALVYINILKPLDRLFVLEGTSKQLIETLNQPVIRVALPETGAVRTVIGQMRLEDEKQQIESYELVFDPPKSFQRFFLTAGVSPGYVNYSEGKLETSEATLSTKLSLTVKLIPRVLDFGFTGYLTLLPIVLSSTPNGLNEARWLGLNYRLGYTLPIGLGSTTLAMMAGLYTWKMLVGGSQFGIKSIGGPQVFFALNHRPLGRLSWGAYLKFAPISAPGSNYRLADNEVAVGFYHDVAWFGLLPRRPQIAFDLAKLHVGQVGGLSIDQLSVTLGLSYPLF